MTTALRTMLSVYLGTQSMLVMRDKDEWHCYQREHLWLLEILRRFSPKFMTFKSRVHLAMISMSIRTDLFKYFGAVLVHLETNMKTKLRLFTAFYLPQHWGWHFYPSIFWGWFFIFLSWPHTCLSAYIQTFLDLRFHNKGAYYSIFLTKLDVYLRESLKPAIKIIKHLST